MKLVLTLILLVFSRPLFADTDVLEEFFRRTAVDAVAVRTQALCEVLQEKWKPNPKPESPDYKESWGRSANYFCYVLTGKYDPYNVFTSIVAGGNIFGSSTSKAYRKDIVALLMEKEWARKLIWEGIVQGSTGRNRAETSSNRIKLLEVIVKSKTYLNTFDEAKEKAYAEEVVAKKFQFNLFEPGESGDKPKNPDRWLHAWVFRRVVNDGIPAATLLTYLDELEKALAKA
jgi:hypothetical protein